MGLFVLQCTHREGESSNPGNLIESPSSLYFIFWQKMGVPVILKGLRGVGYYAPSRHIFFKTLFKGKNFAVRRVREG